MAVKVSAVVKPLESERTTVVEDPNKTEKFKSFLLDVNDGADHARSANVRREKFML